MFSHVYPKQKHTKNTLYVEKAFADQRPKTITLKKEMKSNKKTKEDHIAESRLKKKLYKSFVKNSKNMLVRRKKMLGQELSYSLVVTIKYMTLNRS